MDNVSAYILWEIEKKSPNLFKWCQRACHEKFARLYFHLFICVYRIVYIIECVGEMPKGCKDSIMENQWRKKMWENKQCASILFPCTYQLCMHICLIAGCQSCMATSFYSLLSKGINYVLLVIGTNWNLCNGIDSLFDNRNILFFVKMILIDIMQIRT